MKKDIKNIIYISGNRKKNNNLKLEGMSGVKKKKKFSSLKENVIKEPLTTDQSEKVITKKAHTSLFPMSAMGRIPRDAVVKIHYYQLENLPLLGEGGGFFTDL